MGHCDEHGDYARSYTPEKLEKVISWCREAAPLNWIKAVELAYGKPGDNTEAYERQPGDVRIYNPKELPLSEILLRDSEVFYDGKQISSKSLAFDAIESCGLNMYIPYYYQVAEELVQGCVKCSKNPKSKAMKASIIESSSGNSLAGPTKSTDT